MKTATFENSVVSMENEQDRSKLLGYLMIHVSGYKQISSTTMHLFGDGRAIPDRQMRVADREVNSMLWWEEGWSVGDNPRDRFCQWMGRKEKRRYATFDEATAFVRHLEKSRNKPNESYTLVYGYTGSDGKSRAWPVSTLGEIEKIDSELAIVIAHAQKRLLELKAETPAIDELRRHYNSSHAIRLSLLLKSIQGNGRNTVPEGMSKSTFYRQIAELEKLGLV